VKIYAWHAFPVLFAVVMAFAQNAAQNTSDQDNPPWKAKRIAEWSDEDARQLLADSPWVKSFTPTLASPQGSAASPRMGMGGIGIGGVGIGMPGMGRRGYPNGGGYPGGQAPTSSSGEPPKLTLRWESAMPVRTAELKTRDNDAPVIDDKHYAIAVYGVADFYLNGDSKKVADELKKNASLRRDGKKDVKPSSVELLDKPGGRVVLYMFSTSNEITKDDHRIEFDAKIGRLELNQSFFLDDMVWDGKREI
jgi:hypothetical protein